MEVESQLVGFIGKLKNFAFNIIFVDINKLFHLADYFKFLPQSCKYLIFIYDNFC